MSLEMSGSTAMDTSSMVNLYPINGSGRSSRETLSFRKLTAEQPFAVARHAIDVWGYNNEIHPEGCPITNWWNLTDPELARENLY